MPLRPYGVGSQLCDRRRVSEGGLHARAGKPMKKTTQFRRLIEAEEILVQPGVYDGFSARLIEQMGFLSRSISGAGLSESTLGWADAGLLSYEENGSRSRNIAACAQIPLSADADT